MSCFQSDLWRKGGRERTGERGEKVTAGQSGTKRKEGGRREEGQRGGGRTGKSCWPCISAWWHLAGPI